jgi:type IX secretion system PorP/SprF family membrane protein
MKRNLRFFANTLIGAALLLLTGQAAAQDPVLSQFYSSPIHLNPAFAGTTYAPRIAANYRNQWASIPNAYSTFALSFDKYFEGLKSGLGFSALTDLAGDGIYRTSNFNFIYSYKLPITDELFVKGGVQMGLYQVSVDWDRLVFLDQIDPVSGPNQPSEEVRPEQTARGYFDLTSGLLLYSKQFYAGFTAHHINSPDERILDSNSDLTDGLPVRFSVHGGTQISLSRDNKTKFPAFISPNVMYTKQRNFHQVNAGAYLGLGPLFGGVWFRHTFANSDAAIFLVGYTKGVVKIGYSYDYTVSKLNSQSNGAHEIGLLINLDGNKKRKPDYNDCFNMFR